MANLLDIVARLIAKGITLKILAMGIATETGTPTGRLMLNVLDSVAQFERKVMLERQREGIAPAAAEGRYKGRAPTAMAQAATVKDMHAAGVRPAEIVKRLGIGRSSVYRCLEA